MFELHSPDGAFAALENHLRAEGFFGGRARGVVADLYLGYGLSSLIRRDASSPPPGAVPAPARGLLRPVARAHWCQP